MSKRNVVCPLADALGKMLIMSAGGVRHIVGKAIRKARKAQETADGATQKAQEAVDGLGGKLDKVTGSLIPDPMPSGAQYPTRLYAVAPDGSQKMQDANFGTHYGVLGGTIPIRNTDGSIFIADGAWSNTAATKGYVDGKVSAVMDFTDKVLEVKGIKATGGNVAVNKMMPDGTFTLAGFGIPTRFTVIGFAGTAKGEFAVRWNPAIQTGPSTFGRFEAEDATGNLSFTYMGGSGVYIGVMPSLSTMYLLTFAAADVDKGRFKIEAMTNYPSGTNAMANITNDGNGLGQKATGTATLTADGFEVTGPSGDGITAPIAPTFIFKFPGQGGTIATEEWAAATFSGSREYDWAFVQGLNGASVSASSRMAYWPYANVTSISTWIPWLLSPTVIYPKMDFRTWEGSGNLNVHYMLRLQVYWDRVAKGSGARNGVDTTIYLTPQGFTGVLPSSTTGCYPSGGAVTEIPDLDVAAALLAVSGNDPSVYEADIGSILWSARLLSGTTQVNPRIQYRRHREEE